MRTPNEIEVMKEQISRDCHNRLRHLYTQELINVFDWFKRHYPKRHLKFVAGMGTGFFVLDDEILHWSSADLAQSKDGYDLYYVDAKPDRHARKLLPLWNFYQSIMDSSNVDDPVVWLMESWEIDRVSREIRRTHNDY